MNLILLEPAEIATNGCARLADRRATHLIEVLKVRVGQAVRVGLLDGPMGVGTVTGTESGTVEIQCTLEADPPPRPRVDLLLALPRPKVMKRLWAQLAALGVGRIILTNAERVERNYFDTHVIAPDFFRPLLIEGLQQVRDTRLPAVSVHRQFKILVEDELDGIFGGGLRIVADASAQDSVRSVLTGHTGERVLLAVGPEGGWNKFETDLLNAHNFRAVGMGPRTLRTDTACLALLALVHDALA